MTRKYFGTDGIRGTANQFPMTADMALKVAMATAIVLKDQNPNGGQNRVIIGKDTRLSCSVSYTHLTLPTTPYE